MPVSFFHAGRLRRLAAAGLLCLFAALCVPVCTAQSRYLPEVTDIRYWSTPVYTRVAINLQREVRYEAVRVPSAGRVYFDFYGARLSPTLRGRSDQVIDHGFLRHIRVEQLPGNVVRVVLNVTSISEYSAFFLSNPARLIIDVHASKSGSPPMETASAPPRTYPPVRSETPRAQKTSPITERNLAPLPGHELSRSRQRPPRSAPPERPVARRTVTANNVAKLNRHPALVRATPQPTFGPVAQSVAGTTPAPQPETLIAPPLAAGAKPSMTRVLGLKIHRIVIDAGHGGHDSGAIGPGGIEEKNIALDVALRLGDLLKQRLGAQVVYTRDNNTFVPLETRTAIANKDEADLFISIHANASPDPQARGVAVYYLGFTHSADALAVAARENSASNESIHQLSTLVRKIALQSKLNESRQFATDVDQSLYAGLAAVNPGLPNRGVRRAPFVVLIGANMPSILAEVSFITNPTDAAEMEQPAYRERIAEALYSGVARYVEGLDGMRVADGASAATN